MYRAIQGDTFETIARKVYGDDLKAADVRRANPGLSEPLQPGASVNVPGAPEDSTAGTLDVGPDEVTLKIDGRRFRYWTQVEISRSVDKLSAVTFAAPFDPDDQAQRETFRPFTFRPVTVAIGDEDLFDGTMVAAMPSASPNTSTVAVSCYGRPGVLNDCPPPASAFPFEFNGLNVQQIAEELGKLFGVGVRFEADPGAVFRRVKLEPDKKILPFLIDLAQQRGLIITDTVSGDLLFTTTDDLYFPVATLRQGEQPLVSVVPTFKPQEYYSDITAMKSTKVGSRGSQYTAKNGRLEGVLRPMNFVAKDGRRADTATAARAKLGRMFANAASYVATVATWRDPAGDLWTPNTTVKVLYPNAMIYTEIELLIRDVVLVSDAKSKVARLSLVFPEAFSGGVPEVLPWEG